MPAVVEPGLMGTILDPETNLWMKHRIGVYAGVTSGACILWAVAKAFIPALQSKTAPVSKGEALKLIAIYLTVVVLNVAIIGNEHPRFPETFLLTNRLSILITLHVIYTGIYLSAKKGLAAWGVEPAHCVTQAANLVRVVVKLTMFACWVLPGEVFVPMMTHPHELTSELFTVTDWTIFAMNSLYIWELLFRELKPVNVIHHGMSIIVATSFVEWQNVLEPARANSAFPLLGSVIEGFCCLGSMCYRFMPRGKVLQRLLTALTVFILISYNALAVAYASLIYAYIDLFSFGVGYIWAPALLFFTYPAQMNMAKIYWGMAKRAGKPKAVPVDTVQAGQVKAAKARRQRA